jgi:signal transduction histidine kinase
VDVDPDARRPVASETVITHVVDVLVANALRHGAGDIELVLRDVPGGGAAIEVSDHGAVIPDVGDLFKRRAGSPSGHGIGLALARTLAVAEGGLLQLTENDADRTTFELLLPVHEAGAAPGETAGPATSTTPEDVATPRFAER